MGVGSFLPGCVGPELPEMRNNLRVARQRSIRVDAEYRDSPAGIVRRQQVLATRMDCDVRRLSACALSIQKAQSAGISIDSERGCAARAGFVSGIQKSLG